MSAPSTQELLRELVYKLAPSLLLTGVHTYTVTKAAGDGRYDLAPGTGVLHGPRLRVDQWAAPGVEGTFSVGDKVLVAFVDNDEKKPAIIGHLPLRDGKPVNITVDASGVINIGASSSSVNIGGAGAVALAKSAEIVSWASTINSWAIAVSSALSISPPVVLVSPATTKAKGV